MGESRKTEHKTGAFGACVPEGRPWIKGLKGSFLGLLGNLRSLSQCWVRESWFPICSLPLLIIGSPACILTGWHLPGLLEDLHLCQPLRKSCYDITCWYNTASFPGLLPVSWHSEQLLSCLYELLQLSLFPMHICNWWGVQVGKEYFQCKKDHCVCSQNTWVRLQIICMALRYLPFSILSLLFWEIINSE